MTHVLQQIFPAAPVWTWFGAAGWLLAALLLVVAGPRIYRRLISRLPAGRKKDWNQKLARKKVEISSRWQDPRPLTILAGDSQIEFGNWHDLFAGAWAARNCGLAGAKIADVNHLISAIGDPHPQTVILMCGINNLLAGENPEACLREYDGLLQTIRSLLQPETVLVLSVMPVRETPADRASRRLNANVRQFNAGLEACCRTWQVEFLDVNSTLTDAGGGLFPEFTEDGLHLNPQGYRQLAGIIASRLAKSTA